jgi:hypothetical protein
MSFQSRIYAPFEDLAKKKNTITSSCRRDSMLIVGFPYNLYPRQILMIKELAKILSNKDESFTYGYPTHMSTILYP